jgi:oligoendopeptidase F
MQYSIINMHHLATFFLLVNYKKIIIKSFTTILHEGGRRCHILEDIYIGI